MLALTRSLQERQAAGIRAAMGTAQLLSGSGIRAGQFAAPLFRSQSRQNKLEDLCSLQEVCAQVSLLGSRSLSFKLLPRTANCKRFLNESREVGQAAARPHVLCSPPQPLVIIGPRR